MATKNQSKSTSKKTKTSVTNGKLHINASFNNTILTLTDMNGNTICWTSSGMLGFKGSKKSTPYAAQMATRSLLDKAKNYNVQSVSVYVKGPGIGRDSVLRVLSGSGLHINYIQDITPIPHNGCRPRKLRRI